jgi:hypothetical protein
MFPEYKDFRVTPGMPDALQLASLYLQKSITPADLSDPLIQSAASRDAAARLWRPLLPDQPVAEVLVPVLPFSVAGAPQVICFRGTLPQLFPPQQPVSALLLAGLLRCLHDLRSFTVPQWYRPDLLSGCTGWRQEGLYILPVFQLRGYERIFDSFLDAGVLLNPEEPCISILPAGEISKGELRKMIGLFRAYPGK